MHSGPVRAQYGRDTQSQDTAHLTEAFRRAVCTSIYGSERVIRLTWYRVRTALDSKHESARRTYSPMHWMSFEPREFLQRSTERIFLVR